MKKTVLRTLCAVLCISTALFTLSGCVIVGFTGSGAGISSVSGTGSPERFEFQTGEITEIRVSIFCNIEFYSAPPSGTVTLEIQPNLMEYVILEESGGVLTLRTTRPISYGTSDAVPVLTVSSPSLSTVDFSGAGKFTAHGAIKADEFTFRLAGATECNAELEVNHLSVSIAGAGSMRLSGTADTVSLSVAGAGNVDALSLQTREAEINLGGAGIVRIACSEKLIVDAGGAGTVEYRGNPGMDISRSGMVTIRQVD